MAEPLVEVERDADDAHVAIVRLNRPEVANALSPELMTAIIETCRAFHDQVDVRALVFTGNGRHFSAGADLDAPARPRHRLQARRVGRLGRDLVRAIRGVEAMTIAAIEGAALGGGACIATACDFRVAAEDARCGYPEVNLGMNLQWQALPHCVRLVGPARAKRMIGLGAQHGAGELERWGFIDEITPPGEALAGALRLARACAERPPLALQMIKESVNAVSDAFDAAIMHMDADQWTLTASTRDHAEGIAAWREARTPVFDGD